MQTPRPEVPPELHPLAREILAHLRSRPEAAPIILGGGVALQHYCPFRLTKDIDAWWEAAPVAETQAAIKQVMSEVSLKHGLGLQVRTWGETESYELQQEGQTVFSFQIALRTAELEPPVTSAWNPVKIETFRENLACKMNALVARGAPRDFVDVFEVCHRRLATAQECWDLWRQKNPDKHIRSARANVARHLEQLEARRPLAAFENEHDRARAESVRLWMRTQLCQETGREPGLGL